MKKYIVLLVAVIAMAFSASAQEVVQWTHSVKMTSATEGVVTFTGVIDNGWHVYGLEIPDGGPKPTTFDFSKSTGVTMTGTVTAEPKPVSVFDKAFNMNLQWWANNVTFSQKFKVTDSASAKIIVTLRYMACNDANCMPPKRKTFEIDVPAFKAGAKSGKASKANKAADGTSPKRKMPRK